MPLILNPTTKEIQVNRGDRGTIRLTANTGSFKVGDKLLFSIVERQNYNNVVFQKEYTVLTEGTTFDITLTKQDTTIGGIISNKVEYWYEIQYNGDQTIIGFDAKRAKKFILLPEAPEKNGGNK